MSAAQQASPIATATRPVTAFAVVRSVFLRDLRIAFRRRSDTAAALFFFVIVASLFPLGVGPEPQLLRTMAPGVVWVGALLASMLSLGRLFADDHQDGTLEQLMLSPCPLPLIVLGKMAAHWLCSGLPLTLVAPLLALQFDLPASSIGVLVVSLLIGTPAAQPDRRHRRGADGRGAWRRGVVVAAGAAAVRAGADFRRRSGRRGCRRRNRRGPSLAARGDAGGRDLSGTPGRGIGPADRTRMNALHNRGLSWNRVCGRFALRR